MRLTRCVYDKDHECTADKNTSESDPRSYEVLKQLQIKPRKNSEAPMGFESMTSVIPMQCSTN